MDYEIIIKPSAAADLDKLPNREVLRIAPRLQQLAAEPRPFGAQKLTNSESYRIRSGNYRILYEIDDKGKRVHIFRIRHRREAYR